MTFNFSEAYEALNPADDDYRYYVGLARRLNARTVVDLGCGTGVLATLLVADGREVVGVDPDAEMLRVARSRPGGTDVRWVHGYADALPRGWADMVTMSGHVSQVFRSDDEWTGTLRDIRAGLRPRGVLAFEMRDPEAEGWRRWTRDETVRSVQMTGGTFEFWHETTEVNLPLVTYASYTKNLATGETTSSLDTLAFRDLETLDRSLREAGFEDVTAVGSWDGGPVVTGETKELIVAARRA